jgi:hypothetical protein
MCLYISKETKKKHTWFKPIKVYKILNYRPLVGAYETPFRNMVVGFNTCYRSGLERVSSTTRDRIELGLHSLCTMDDASKLYDILCWDYPNICIVECVIPRFSTYYEGDFISNGKLINSIASSKIIYLKKL